MHLKTRFHGQMSDTFHAAVFVTLSGGFQDAYTYICRGQVFANAQTGNIVLLSAALLRAFADRLAEGLSAEDLAHFRRCVAIFDRNIEQIRAEKSKRTEIQNP